MYEYSAICTKCGKAYPCTSKTFKKLQEKPHLKVYCDECKEKARERWVKVLGETWEKNHREGVPQGVQPQA